MTASDDFDGEFKAYLEASADKAGFVEPKRSRWIRYSMNTASRVALMENLLSALPNFDAPSATMLDVGCGYGNLLLAAEPMFGGVAGIEIEEDRVEWSLKRVPSADAVVGTAAQLPWPDSTFDLVVCTDVFEHIDHPTQLQAASEVARVLKPGGYFYIAVPNRFQLWDEHNKLPLTAWFRGRLRQRLVEMASKGPFVECWELTRSGWRSLFEGAGLKFVRVLVDNEGVGSAKRIVNTFAPQRTSSIFRKPGGTAN
ncbi:MAG: class I SAM-dependent methyltransferase [Armatimonadetes bacterium]|nr:class I SAM-dependent methyltransferase [Armatimonadota bacterium]